MWPSFSSWRIRRGSIEAEQPSTSASARCEIWSSDVPSWVARRRSSSSNRWMSGTRTCVYSVTVDVAECDILSIVDVFPELTRTAHAWPAWAVRFFPPSFIVHHPSSVWVRAGTRIPARKTQSCLLLFRAFAWVHLLSLCYTVRHCRQRHGRRRARGQLRDGRTAVAGNPSLPYPKPCANTAQASVPVRWDRCRRLGRVCIVLYFFSTSMRPNRAKSHDRPW